MPPGILSDRPSIDFYPFMWFTKNGIEFPTQKGETGMKDQALKKAYRRMCKEQKTQGYRYTIWGSVFALIGLIVVAAFLLLQACTTVFQDVNANMKL